MKKVLISCSTHDALSYQERLSELSVDSIVSGEILDSQDYDGLLLPGGGDIAPFFYHRKNKGSNHICITEDVIQLLLFHRFMEQKKPILGICKGMQLINVALGGTLIQELSNTNLHYSNQADIYHNTILLPGSVLHSLYHKNIRVNSSHHQAVDNPGKNLIAVQHSYDGTIEGLEHNTLPILGVQWHPERLHKMTSPKEYSLGLPVFEWFVSKL